MVDELLPPTETEFTVNDAVVEPAGTVTLDGTVATPVLLLLSVIAAPPLGAGPFKATVPVDLAPAITVDGLSVKEDRPLATDPPDSAEAHIFAMD